MHDSPLGNPLKLQKKLKEKGLQACYLNRKVSGYTDIGILKWLAYFFFDLFPSLLVFKSPPDPYSLAENPQCLPLASDIPVIVSVWHMDIPDYDFILGVRRNVYYSENCENHQENSLIPYVGTQAPKIYAYSNHGFFFPGDRFKVPAYLNASFFEKKILVFLLKEQSVYKVFEQRSIKEPIKEPGTYSLKAYTYSFRIWRFYFGLRFLACTPPFYAM